MIRAFLLLLACIAGSWFIADAIEQKGPGYVYIYFNQYSIETSVWFAAALLLSILFLLFIIFRVIPLLIKKLMYWGYLPGWLGMGRAQKMRYQGRLAFINQHWRLASVKLAKSAKKSDTGFIDYMMAARASLQAGDIEQAKTQLGLAEKTNDFDKVTSALLSLDIAMVEGDIAQQEQQFQVLLAEYANHPAVMVRAATLYCEKARWQALQPLLPKLKKKKFITEQAYFELLASVVIGRLKELSANGNRKEIKSVWKLATKVQDRTDVVIAYSSVLVSIQETGEAQKLIEARLLQDCDDTLVQYYATLPLADKALQLAFAEDLLGYHAHNASLLSALGVIAKQGGYYAKARDYLLRSLQIQPLVASCEALADIAIIQNDYAQANHYLRQALLFTQK